jgi:hypothetical protein
MPLNDVVRQLMFSPQPGPPPGGSLPSFPPRIGVDVSGRGITSPIIAALSLADGHGLSPAQMDRNQAMQGPLYSLALREYPEILAQKMSQSLPPSIPYSQTDRRMLAEDLNATQIKFDNWKKANIGQELTPQDRITQGFVDVRNPNSWF